MTLSSVLALSGSMIVLALIPSVSVLAVCARSASSGFVHGVLTAIGIVAGDIFFVVLALSGLSLLADAMGPAFAVIRYLGGAYLIFLGVRLWRSRSVPTAGIHAVDSSRLSSFMTGLLITLGDHKAILFYLAFLPAFLDLSAMSYADMGIVVVATAVSVGSVKIGYAYLADRAGVLFDPTAGSVVNIGAGGIMVAVGIFLMATT